MPPSSSRIVILPSTIAVVLAARLAGAQPPKAAVAEIHIRVAGEKAANAQSGMLTFPRQGLQAQVSVVGTDTAGKPVSLGRFSPRWSSSDKNVVSTYGNPADNPVAVSLLAVAQQDGRATLTVTAAGKTASIPVVVGNARQTIAASELTPKFRVARLELVAEKGNAGPEADASAAGVRLRENGHGVLLRAQAYAADDTPIPLADFPVTWTGGDDKIVELYQTDEQQTQITAHAVGATTVSATIQGATATVNVQVLPMGTVVGPMAGPQVVARAGGGAGMPVAKEPPTAIGAAPPGSVVTGVAAPVVGTATTAPATGEETGPAIPTPPPGGRTAMDPIALGALAPGASRSITFWFAATTDTERWLSLSAVGGTCASAGQARPLKVEVTSIPAGRDFALRVGPGDVQAFLGGGSTTTSAAPGASTQSVTRSIPCGGTQSMLVKIERSAGAPSGSPSTLTITF